MYHRLIPDEKLFAEQDSRDQSKMIIFVRINLIDHNGILDFFVSVLEPGLE